MTKHEIEQAAKNVYPQCDGLRNIYNNADNDLKEEGFIKGANFVNSKQPYTAEDMEDCITWISNSQFDFDGNGWVSTKIYYSGCIYSFCELLKLWEVSKNEKHT